MKTYAAWLLLALVGTGIYQSRTILTQSATTASTTIVCPGGSGYVKCYPRPRFEHILTQKILADDGNRDGGVFAVFHDNETGQEIVCMSRWLPQPSCYLTGRKWNNGTN